MATVPMALVTTALALLLVLAPTLLLTMAVLALLAPEEMSVAPMMLELRVLPPTPLLLVPEVALLRSKMAQSD